MGLFDKAGEYLERGAAYIDGRTGQPPQSNSQNYLDTYRKGAQVRQEEAFRDEIDRKNRENQQSNDRK